MARLLLALLALTGMAAIAASQPVYSQPLYKIYKAPTKKQVKKMPGKKLVKRPIAPVRKGPAPFTVQCDIASVIPPQKIINCKVFSRLKVPACAHLQCNPGPGGACGQSGSAGGQMTQPDCSWNVVGGCSSPQALYPGQPWSFGFFTSAPGPISITVPVLNKLAFSPAINGTLCQQ